MAAKMFRKLQVFTKTTDFKMATKLVKAPLREPKGDEIRIRNIYAGVNATDINITAGRYSPGIVTPYDFGLEALGVVDAIGPAAETKLKLGQPVVINNGFSSGGFAEYIYQQPKHLYPVPDLRPEYLVAFVNGMTATIGLDEAGRIKAADKVLITAAAGGTGQIAVQWAKQQGCYVIALTSSEAKARYLREELGADFVINYRDDDLDQVLSEKFPEGVDVVWETIGGETFETLFKHLSNRGRLVIIGTIESYKGDGIRGGKSPDNLNGKLLIGSKSLTGFVLFHYFDVIPEYFAKIVGQIKDGKLKARVDLGEKSQGGPFVGLESTWRAEEHLHSAKNVGKVVIKVQEL